jgi:hypothetical protein
LQPEVIGGGGRGQIRIGGAGYVLAEEEFGLGPRAPFGGHVLPDPVGALDVIIEPQFAPFYRWRWIQNKTAIVALAPNDLVPNPGDVMAEPFGYMMGPYDGPVLVSGEPTF